MQVEELTVDSAKYFTIKMINILDAHLTELY